MERDKLSAAFSEWMRRYIEDPDKFEREFETVANFEGGEKDYGDQMADYLIDLITEMEGNK